MDTTVNAPIYDIDYRASETGTLPELQKTIATLKARGVLTICYLETGGWESYRPDAKAYPAVVLGAPVEGYTSERYVDVRRWDVLGPILTARFRHCKDMGFDGVETDLDAEWQSATGFPLTQADYEAFNVNVANAVHDTGLKWFMKNGITGGTFIEYLETFADGIVVEQCWQFAECEELRPFADAEKPILNAEYGGLQSVVCPKAEAFPMRTIRKTEALTKTIRWACN